MKRSRFSEEPIIGILREQEAGAKAADLCRKHGMSEATLYNWKAKYAGMEVSDAKRLRALEDENAKLKKLLAESMLDASGPARAARKKVVGPAAQRAAIAHLQASFGLSERRACSLIGADRGTIRYRTCRPDDAALLGRLRELAQTRRRFGYRRLFVLLRREGETAGLNRVYRLYRQEGLSVRKRQARRRAVGTRAPFWWRRRPMRAGRSTLSITSSPTADASAS
jgi:transposase InsO family protein